MVKMPQRTISRRDSTPRIHHLQLELPPKPHPKWQDLDPDVQTLLCKMIDVSPQKPYFVRYWDLGRDGKPHPNAFLRTHVRAMGFSEARAKRAIGKAIELKLIDRPNPKGGKQLLPSKDNPGPDDYYAVDGDYAYVTALGYKLTRNEKLVAPVK